LIGQTLAMSCIDEVGFALMMAMNKIRFDASLALEFACAISINDLFIFTNTSYFTRANLGGNI
jgi:hypothetical protein